MDPNEALKKVREALVLYNRRYNDKGTGLSEANDLADAFESLDHWFSCGGFLPQDWAKAHEIRVAALARTLVKPTVMYENGKAEYEGMRTRLIEVLGYDAFRALQEEAFQRIIKQ
jgi:hypothetical protein